MAFQHFSQWHYPGLGIVLAAFLEQAPRQSVVLNGDSFMRVHAALEYVNTFACFYKVLTQHTLSSNFRPKLVIDTDIGSNIFNGKN